MMDRHWTTEDVERFADGEASREDLHLRECARCANAVLATAQMKRAVRDAMDVGPAPASLRARLTKQPWHRSPAAPWWIAAAAVIAAIVVLSPLLLRNQSQPALAELVDMHVTMLASANPVDVTSTDRHTVKPWFEGRVPFAVPVPNLSSTPFRLIGGRVVYWHGNQAAYLLIGKSAHRISLFVFRRENAPKTLGQPPPAISTLSWEDDGLTFVAVADVPPADLAQLRDAFNRR
jgi:anti-sigma factor RsiW